MKSFVISDSRDTIVGMRLAGISGVKVEKKEDILSELYKAFDDNEVGILILTEVVFEKIQEEATELKLHHKFPLIVEIPDRFGQKREKNYITKYINESIGIKL